MNLFNIADTKKAVAESKKSSTGFALKSTTVAPYFLSKFRIEKEDTSYSIKVKKGKRKVSVPVVPVTGTFIISFFTCLAHDIVKDENQYRAANNSLPYCDCHKYPVTLTTYLVEALIESEGFTFDDYSAGKTAGAKRIANHIKATAKKNRLPFSVVEQEIKGITDDIASAVITVA